jgi:protein subunit release factor B
VKGEDRRTVVGVGKTKKYVILRKLIMITNQKQDAIIKLMQELEISDVDILEKFIKGSGKGGQKVNKTSSTVYVKHLPSGIEVTCNKTRCREDDRFFAKRILVEKIQESLTGTSRKLKMIERIKKQKARRKRRSVKAGDGGP